MSIDTAQLAYISNLAHSRLAVVKEQLYMFSLTPKDSLSENQLQLIAAWEAERARAAEAIVYIDSIAKVLETNRALLKSCQEAREIALQRGDR